MMRVLAIILSIWPSIWAGSVAADHGTEAAQTAPRVADPDWIATFTAARRAILRCGQDGCALRRDQLTEDAATGPNRSMKRRAVIRRIKISPLKRGIEK